MEYIVHKRLKENVICGDVNLKRGTVLFPNGQFICYEGKPVCAKTSEIAHKYIARNDDGKGLERGKLTNLLAYSSENKYGSRFNDSQRSILVNKYSRFLKEECDYILFNQKFFDASIEELEEIKKDMEAAE